MKLEVIGWTDYDDSDYPAHAGDSGSVLRAVVSEIRLRGYRFGGNTHQGGYSGAPVLNDGTMATWSMRGWGGVMAKAWNIERENGMAYMAWYMDNVEELMGETPRKLVLPPRGVEKSRIVKRSALAETHVMHLCDEAFAAVKSGKKTVELRLCDEKRSLISRDDHIEFHSGNGETITVKVTGVDTFEDFELMMGIYPPDLEFLRDEKRDAKNLRLVRRALFGACKTSEALLAYLHNVYSEERRKEYYAMAIQIKKENGV